ncbi:MAG: alpha/beta hydrolase, partial [bacterium]|nr:alpha/beta hydrolase [bacterium]
MNRTPPILFIPGWAATDQAWSAVRSRLAGVRTHDLGWVAAQRDEAAVRTILAREPEPWLLVGWSLGALLALRAALASPARLRGLILISGTARICAAGAAYS